MKKSMKRLYLVLVFIFVLAVLSGCWDRKEPGSLALVNSIIYDLNEEEGYEVIIEIRNPAGSGAGMGGGGSSNQNPSLTITGKGESIPEALRKVSSHLERTLFGGQNRARFFTERFARKDMYGVMDFLARDFITDEKSFVIVIKNDDPRIIYSVKIGLSDVVGEYIENLNNNQQRMYANAPFVSTLKFLQNLYDEGKQPVAGVVEATPCLDNPAQNVQGGETGGGDSSADTQKTMKLEYKGLAAFKDGKLVGYLDEKGARVYNLITNELETAFISVNAEQSKIAAYIDKSDCKIKAKPSGENFEFEVNVNVVLGISQIDGNINILEKEKSELVGQAFSEKIKDETEKAITTSQTDFNSDIFGFGSFIHRQFPKEWKNIKSKWKDIYASAKINVKVKVLIKSAGAYKKSIEEEAGK